MQSEVSARCDTKSFLRREGVWRGLQAPNLALPGASSLTAVELENAIYFHRLIAFGASIKYDLLQGSSRCGVY